MIKTIRIYLVLYLASSWFFVVGQLHARDLEETIVTAQKREQSLQSVPIFLSVTDGEEILEDGLVRLEDLSDSIPAVFISEAFTGQQIYIRGIGTGVSNVSFEQSVASFTDGVYTGRGRQSLIQFLDVDRIEILKGPQPTYFGQNAIAGAVNMFTRTPGDDWEGYLSLFAESEIDSYSLDFAYGGPLTDTFGARVAARILNSGGFGENTFTGEELNAHDGEAVRLSIAWDPIREISVNAKWEETRFTQDSYLLETTACNANGVMLRGNLPVSLPTPCNLAEANFGTEYNLDQQQATGGSEAYPGAVDLSGLPDLFDDQRRELDSSGGHLAIEYEMDNALFTATTGYNEYTGTSRFDLDATPYALFNVRADEAYDQISQEIRIQSLGDGEHNIDWMLGAYWQDSDIDYGAREYNGIGTLLGVPAAGTGGILYQEEASWQSLFAAVTYPLSSSFDLDLGMRYSDVEKSAVSRAWSAGPIDPVNGLAGPFMTLNDGCINTPNQNPIVAAGPTGPLPVCANADFQDDNVSGNLGVNYRLDEEVTFYAKYSNGFKAGGLNAGMSVAFTLNDFVYESETVDSFELGFKSILMDGRFEFNAAVFASEYKDLQVSMFNAASGTVGQFTVGNAAESSTEGLEVMGRYAATDSLILSYSMTWLDAKYDDFDGAQCNLQEVTAGACSANNTTNRAGETIEFAPDFEMGLGAEYVFALVDNFDVILTGDLFHSGGYGLSSIYDRRLVQDAYTLIDLRITLAEPSGRWSISAFGENLADELVYSQVGPTILNDEAFVATSSEGRSFGVQAKVEF